MNKLNVFHYGIYPWKYPRNWFRNIPQIFRCIKFGYQRITKGYCGFDLCDLAQFYLKLFDETLKEFQKNLYGAPCEYFDNENNSVQPWIDYIEEMRQHFYNSDELNVENEYWDDIEKEITANGNIFWKDRKETEAHKKWWNRQLELDEWREEEFHKGMKMLDKVFFNLWD